MSFKAVLNSSKEGIVLISKGREFQSKGADAEKDRLPYVCDLEGWTERRCCEDDRRVRAGVCL